MSKDGNSGASRWNLERATAHFWSRVQQPPTGCWEWTGPRVGRGYGKTTWHSRSARSHRVAWEITYGPIPTGLAVLHHCDNPLCCRPDHLFLGTLADNNRDMRSKGRQAHGDRSGSRLHPERLSRGDNHYSRTRPEALARDARHGSALHPDKLARGTRHGKAKLTEARVEEIRVRYMKGGVTTYQLATEMQVSPTAIQAVVNGKTWTHVPMPTGRTP